MMTAFRKILIVWLSASLCLNWVRPVVMRVRGQRIEQQQEYDKTGLVSGSEKPSIWYDDGVVVFAGYESIAHSLWRSQELSLIRNHKVLLQSPIGDFGCGDGTFSSLIFNRLDFGIDNDPDAVRMARMSALYTDVVQSSSYEIPLPSESLGSVFSNSVLEHVTDIEKVLSEIHRVLRDRGVLLVTIPVVTFEQHLAYFFGKQEARAVNNAYYHRNLYEIDHWRRLFSEQGFTVESVLEYQPIKLSYWYYMLRLCGKRGFGVFYNQIPRVIWNVFGQKMIAAVQQSIIGVQNGANVLIIAKKISSHSI